MAAFPPVPQAHFLTPRIRYLNGTRFRRALIAGARQVIENRLQLNAINVFPVADGDTGTNMGGTLGSIVDAIRPSRETAIHRTLRSIADHALAGARGCSGTILAQFLHGLAEELSDAARVTTRVFGLGVQRAIAYPYQAVADPREGTILTVLRDWGEKVFEWSGRSDDFIEVLHHAYRAARSSLAATTEKLAVLRRAGVVDAGAQGLVHMLAGITRFIARGRIRELDSSRFDAEPQGIAVEEAAEDPIHRYCTQFVLEGSDIDPAYSAESWEIWATPSSSRARRQGQRSTCTRMPPRGHSGSWTGTPRLWARRWRTCAPSTGQPTRRMARSPWWSIPPVTCPPSCGTGTRSTAYPASS